MACGRRRAPGTKLSYLYHVLMLDGRSFAAPNIYPCLADLLHRYSAPGELAWGAPPPPAAPRTRPCSGTSARAHPDADRRPPSAHPPPHPFRACVVHEGRWPAGAVPVQLRSPLFVNQYRELVADYAYQSHHDPLYQTALVLGLHTAGVPEARGVFWSDLAMYLNRMAVGVASVPIPAGYVGYLWPRERDVGVRAATARALITAGLDAARTPFLYWLAVHHLAPDLEALSAPGLADDRTDATTTDPATAFVPLPSVLSSDRALAATLMRLLHPVTLLDWLGYAQPGGPAVRDDALVLLPPQCYRARRAPLAATGEAVAAAAGEPTLWSERLAHDPELRALLEQDAQEAAFTRPAH